MDFDRSVISSRFMDPDIVLAAFLGWQVQFGTGVPTVWQGARVVIEKRGIDKDFVPYSFAPSPAVAHHLRLCAINRAFRLALEALGDEIAWVAHRLAHSNVAGGSRRCNRWVTSVESDDALLPLFQNIACKR